MHTKPFPSKRRRVSSNPPIVQLAPSDSNLVVPAKPCKISTCITCHRAVGLKSSPALTCTRCGVSTCAICARTCSGSPPPSRAPSPAQAIPSPLSRSDTNTMPLRRRRPREDEEDPPLKPKDPEHEVVGCGRLVCRPCCVENPQSGATTCLDCPIPGRRVLQAHGSDVFMHEAFTMPGQGLIATL
ncbi:hypothetical protein BC834DRAFT_881118 [Gloeopeniophorella convolvens]|nr:hypothetical protein BC834DRAFT_881118 [Gloeopeniophorella convolvens]